MCAESSICGLFCVFVSAGLSRFVEKSTPVGENFLVFLCCTNFVVVVVAES